MKKRVTIQDIANEAGVSKTTVSFYLNEKYDKMSSETRIKIKDVIESNEYRPNLTARNLKAKSSKLIGVIVTDITIPFSNQLVKGIDEIARKHNYQVVMGNTSLSSRREEKYLTRMIDMGVDGIIIQPTSNFFNHHNTIQSNKCKVVIVDSIEKQDVYPWVRTNDKELINEMVSKIYNEYDNFIHISEDLSVLTIRKERVDYFTEALKKYKLKSKELIIDKDLQSSDLTLPLSKIIDKSKKTLIYAINGKLLQKTFDALKLYDSNFSDYIGLVGYDNWDWVKYSSPTVTTIIPPTFEEGKLSAQILINAIEQKKYEHSSIINGYINWRESTDKHKKS